MPEGGVGAGPGFIAELVGLAAVTNTDAGDREEAVT
jgi:hypothetical protein